MVKSGMMTGRGSRTREGGLGQNFALDFKKKPKNEKKTKPEASLTRKQETNKKGTNKTGNK